MDLRSGYGLVVLFFLSSCSASTEPGTGPGGAQAESAVTEPTTVENDMNPVESAVAATNEIGGDLALVNASGSVALVIRYHRGNSQHASSCSLIILEINDRGAKIVARSDAVLECSLDPDVEAVKASTESKITANTIAVRSEAGTGRSEFELRKEADDDWYVGKVGFIRPEEDSETGDMVVVKESVMYPIGSRVLRVSDYSFDRIEHDLVRSIVQ